MHMQNAIKSWRAGIRRAGRGSERRAPGRRAYTAGAGRVGRRALSLRPTQQSRLREAAAGAPGRAASAGVRADARASSRTRSRRARAGRRAQSGGCASACRSRRSPAACQLRAPNEHTNTISSVENRNSKPECSYEYTINDF